MSSLQPVRGTHDLLPADSVRHRLIQETARELAERYGFAEIATPIFEFTEVFLRTLGDTSDIVSKEMYRFVDKGGDDITLRPEGTAGVVRAVISGGLAQELPLKFFYSGPMFRYERPQKGRLRQFHQIGVELLGVAEPQGDIEVIALGAAALAALGVLDKTTLELNTLGSAASRARYRAVLVAYLGDHRGALSADSQERLTRNPLRILDSKDEGDRRIVAGAPLFADSLDQESAEFFAALCAGLDALGIAYRRNPRLVRGLDYYCHTAFEFTTEALGAQGTVLAGGRYDGLVAAMGGPQVAGVGWAAGIDRLALMLPGVPAPRRPIAVIPAGSGVEAASLAVAQRLRGEGFVVDLAYHGNLRRRLRRADRIGAVAAVIVGEEELARGAVNLRDLASRDQTEVALDALSAHLERYR